MKTIIFFAALCLISCDSDQKNTPEQITKLSDTAGVNYDSISVQNSATESIIDSLEEITVFRNLFFTDSEASVHRKLQNDAKIEYLESRVNKEYIYITEIGEYSYGIYPEFDKNRFFRLRILSYNWGSDKYFTKVRDNWQNLVDIISLKFGYHDGLYSNYYDIRPGCINWTHIWRYGDKIIKIGVEQREKDSSCRAVAWIYYQPIADSLEAVKEFIKQKKSWKTLMIFRLYTIFS